jgi:hypothetical protein
MRISRRAPVVVRSRPSYCWLVLSWWWFLLALALASKTTNCNGFVLLRLPERQSRRHCITTHHYYYYYYYGYSRSVRQNSLLLHEHDKDDDDDNPKKETQPTSWKDDKDASPRDTPLGVFLRGIVNTGMSPEIGIQSIVVAKADLPHLGIWMDQSYQVESIYLQNQQNNNNNTIERIPLIKLIVIDPSESVPSGYTQYLQVYNPAYHDDKPVIVTPEEIGLVSLRDEIMDSILFALPVLGFWMTTSAIFAKTYNERYGGNFFDAFWGR